MSGQDGFVHLHVHSEYSMLDGAARVKELIAEAVLAHLQPGQSIFLDAGTTVELVAEKLQTPRVNVLTNAVEVARMRGSNSRRCSSSDRPMKQMSPATPPAVTAISCFCSTVMNNV